LSFTENVLIHPKECYHIRSSSYSYCTKIAESSKNGRNSREKFKRLLLR